MPEGILDFFELVWAESQSLDIHVQAMQALRIVSHGTLQVSQKVRIFVKTYIFGNEREQ